MQIEEEGLSEYLSDQWNRNDMFMIFLTFFYCGLILFGENHNMITLPINGMEFTEEHFEDEIIITMM